MSTEFYTSQPTLLTTLKERGVRPTRQRTAVYECILTKRDHPTADDILSRVRHTLPTISFATVYNCLETLVSCGLVRQVNFDRSPSRYCPNLSPHAHFKCEKTGEIFDLKLNDSLVHAIKDALPPGFVAENFDLTFNGSHLSQN